MVLSSTSMAFYRIKGKLNVAEFSLLEVPIAPGTRCLPSSGQKRCTLTSVSSSLNLTVMFVTVWTAVSPPQVRLKLYCPYKNIKKLGPYEALRVLSS